MADQVKHGCSLTGQQDDNAHPVRLSKDELEKIGAAYKAKTNKGLMTYDAGVHTIGKELMPYVKAVIGDRPLL